MTDSAGLRRATWFVFIVLGSSVLALSLAGCSATALSRMIFGTPDAARTAEFVAADKDHDGSLSPDEAASAKIPPAKDSNQDGLIDRTEFGEAPGYSRWIEFGLESLMLFLPGVGAGILASYRKAKANREWLESVIRAVENFMGKVGDPAIKAALIKELVATREEVRKPELLAALVEKITARMAAEKGSSNA